MSKNDLIESFPANKRQFKFAAPPEMIFFDVDDDPEEAAFIRVDDLFKNAAAIETQRPAKKPEKKEQNGETIFTLIPRKRYQFIDSVLSRVIRRSLAITAARECIPLTQTRVRPVFVQWRVTLPPRTDRKRVIRIFRRDLERHMAPYLTDDAFEDGAFWADNCLIQLPEEELTINQMVRFVNKYQKI